MTEGIVLQQRAMDEHDSILFFLTKERGVINAYVRGARKPRSTLRAGCELLTHTDLVLFYNKGRYSVDKADVHTLFMGVRSDVEKLALASYFCQIAQETAPHEEPAGEYLRLLLNSLYLMDKDKRPSLQVKAVFELRLLTMAGFMPDLTCCAGCGSYEAEENFFFPLSGMMVCKDCIRNYPNDMLRLPLSKTVLAAMRHILYAQTDRLFHFVIPQNQLADLNEISQFYLMTQLEKRFPTLDFYLSMRPKACLHNDTAEQGRGQN